MHLHIDGMKTQEARGKGPILALMSLARQNGRQAQPADGRDAGEAAGQKNCVAGHSPVAFCEPVPEVYGAAERKFLLALARTTLTQVVTNGPLPDINAKDVPPKLARSRGCFVTLRKQGQLRGCVGQLLPQEPLYLAVEDNAQNAAMRDRRFLPVRAGEVDKIKIEISVLTDPQPLRFRSPEELLGQLKPDEGVVLKIGSHSATYLPQVWEQLPGKVEFLNQLSKKAGCEPSAWRDKAAKVAIYHVQAFEEGEQEFK